MKTVLCDIDHTLTDAAWRDKWLGDWPTYHLNSIYDKPIKPIIHMVNGMALFGWHVCLFTSRNESYRYVTMEWLTKHCVLADELLMRPDDEYAPCGEFKFRLAQERFGKELIGIKLVIDNLESVLEPFREMGIATLLAGVGSPCITQVSE